MKNKNKKLKETSSLNRQGFTVVEITLVMAFIAVLLIAIALVISNIMAVYQKGLTLKSVDSVGRNLIEEFTTAINSAPSIDTANLCRTHTNDDTTREQCEADNAYKFIFQSREANSEALQYSGVLCTGNYSYIWNTQYGVQAGQSLNLEYRDKSGNKQIVERPSLARFEDKNYLACAVSMASNYTYTNNFVNQSNHTVSIIDLENGQENPIADPETNFLEGSELPLMLYELTVFPISQDPVTLRSFFSGTFILATEQQKDDASITRTDDLCKVQNADAGTLDIGSRFNYCAINKFNFAARTAGV